MTDKNTPAIAFIGAYYFGDIYLATGVDEPEGRMIVEWLARRLGIEAIR